MSVFYLLDNPLLEDYACVAMQRIRSRIEVDFYPVDG